MPLIATDVLTCAVGTAPARLAVTLDEEKMTFGEVQILANRFANVLLGLGARAGERAAWWSDTSLDGVGLYFALSRIGVAFVPLNPAYTDDELAAVLAYVRPQFLIADAAHAERAEQLVVGGETILVTVGGRGRQPGVSLSERAVIASPADPSVWLPAEEAPCTIFLTSGSTGRPKGVVVSQRATWLRTHAGAAAYSTTGGSGEVIMFPLFHMAGWNFAMMAWSARHTAHLVRRADATQILGAVDRWSPSILYCIPAVWRRILESDMAVDARSVEWALTGTSQVTPELLAGIKDRFPSARTTVNYGSTETARAVGLRDPDLFTHPGSVGHPIPGVRAMVADDGELLITSDRLMSGYFELPAETAQALQGGWYHTGDLAEQNDEGYLYIVGRKKEVIRTGGETVAPVEVEAALAGYPGVADLAIVGIPDAQWGELVCAVVVLHPGADMPGIDGLRAHIGDRLAPYKHPRRVVVAEALPRTSATGQVQRAKLAQEYGTSPLVGD
jgi:acyl-CoA synthetase (AMP-forming)/AMP-acid ligase II